MAKGRIYIPMLLSILVLSTFASYLTTPINADIPSDNAEAEKVEKILWIANTAKRRVEILINLTLTNKTIIETINETGLYEELMGNITLFSEGVELLNNSTEYFNEGDYVNATSYAMQSIEIFHSVFRNINRILCQSNVKREELIDGQGLLEAMNRALARIERIRSLLRNFEEKGINVSEALEILNEAESCLNITRAMGLLQQGNVSEVAGMLAEANRLMKQAYQKLKEIIRETISERIEQFKEKLERLRERIRERLREVNETEDEFFKHWNFTTANEFWREHLEILERVRKHSREGINATGLRIIGERMREVSLELEMRLRERMGEEAANVEVNVEKTVETIIGSRITVRLKITIRNNGNITLIFPNAAFGIIIEKKVGEGWRFYDSPISAQHLRFLKPKEIGEVRITLRVAESGNYRVAVRAWSREGLQTIEYAEFTLP